MTNAATAGTLDATLWSVLGNSQRLDGGAMFGNAPKAVWQRWAEPDDGNRIALATRALLVRERSGRNVLLEAGIGAFFEPALRARYGVVEDEHVLVDNLATLGLSPDDIDVVVLSHLHFDHAGGILEAWDPNAVGDCDRRGGRGAPGALSLAFGRSSFVVSDAALERARHPHPRDRASFIAGLPDLLEETGRLEVVNGPTSEMLGDGYSFHFSQGHTPGLMLTEVAAADGPVLFAGDLVPGRAWVHLPITMGYDRFPELIIDEKEAVLSDLVERGGRLFLTHDADVAMVTPEFDGSRFTPGTSWAVLEGAA